MSLLQKARKNDLLTLIEELGLTADPKSIVAVLIDLIKKDKNYDEKFAKTRLEIITLELQEKEKEQKEESDREYELKKLKTKASIENSVSLTTPKKQNLLKLMPRYNIGSDISVYFSLFERQIIE